MMCWENQMMWKVECVPVKKWFNWFVPNVTCRHIDLLLTCVVAAHCAEVKMFYLLIMFICYSSSKMVISWAASHLCSCKSVLFDNHVISFKFQIGDTTLFLVDYYKCFKSQFPPLFGNGINHGINHEIFQVSLLDRLSALIMTGCHMSIHIVHTSSLG